MVVLGGVVSVIFSEDTHLKPTYLAVEFTTFSG
jgi:hypothetical protein